MTDTETSERRAIAKAIMLEMQCQDFGTRLENGDFRCSSAQIDLLEKCTNAAADRVLAALSAAPKPQGDDLEPVEMVRRLLEPCRDYTGEMIVRDSTPRYEIHCDILYDAASALQSLKAERDEARELNQLWTQRDRMPDLVKAHMAERARAETAEAENATLKREIAELRDALAAAADAAKSFRDESGDFVADQVLSRLTQGGK